MHRPRLIIAGLSGGAGKTMVSLGLARAWARQGRIVIPFKKGPDYIDAAWLALAAQNKASNLDPFLMREETLRALFWNRAQDAQLCCIEGNRGLFDGKDLQGSCSTASLARLLQAPVVLVMDCTKMTRTAAAIVAGCLNFEPDTPIAGVICNRVAGERHREMLKQCIEHYTELPVLGTLPKAIAPISERHMGLVSSFEHQNHEAALENLADAMEQHCDLEQLWEIADKAPDEPQARTLADSLWPQDAAKPVVPIGVIRDAALWFYYEENIEALRRAGAQIVELSLLEDKDWPEIGGLYLGGGYPELHTEALARNNRVRQRVRQLVEMGMPVFAECGGFMYLCESILHEGHSMPMAGVFPVRIELTPRPQGLGYVEAFVDHETPFFRKGGTLQGHEFHYSRAHAADGAELTFAFKLRRGQGILAGLDGLVHKQTLASYTHIHALGVPEWAHNFVAAAGHFRSTVLA